MENLFKENRLVFMAEGAKEKVAETPETPVGIKEEATGEKAEKRARDIEETRLEGDEEAKERGKEAEEKTKEELAKIEQEGKIKAKEYLEQFEGKSEKELAELPDEVKKKKEECEKILAQAQEKTEAVDAQAEQGGWLDKIGVGLASAAATLGKAFGKLLKSIIELLKKIGINLEEKEAGPEIIVKSPLGGDTQLEVTSWPGKRPQPETGKGEGSEYHDGIDVKAENAELFAGVSGKVIEANEDKKAGKYVKIELPNGAKITYAHLREFSVKQGEPVGVDTKIGVTGNTGISTGPHLHISVEKDGVKINPSFLFGSLLKNQPDEAKQKEIAQYFENISKAKPA